MKDMLGYNAGEECGHIIEAKYNKGMLIPPTATQALGHYVEYNIAKHYGFESLPKDGKIPQAGMMVSGKDKLAPYRLADQNVQRVIRYLTDMGLKIVAAGVKRDFGRFTGTIDFIAEATRKVLIRINNTGDVMKLKKGDRIIIDHKYSGLLDANWSKFGWNLLDNPKQREYNAIQARQYHMICEGLPFFFLVVSSKNDTDVLFFHANIKPESIESHKEQGNKLMAQFEYERNVGFEARPDVSKCDECPLKDNCRDRVTYPSAIQINL